MPEATRTVAAEVGAYGIRIAGVTGADGMLVAADPGWPRLRIESTVGPARELPERITEDRAELVLRTGGNLFVDRREELARYLVPRPLRAHELVHPYLAPAAAVVAHWRRRPCFHGGAFVAGDGAWALLGDREAGKSSLLAALALHGHDVVADDVLVIEGSDVFTGPRAIDLREEAAAQLEVGEALGTVGARPRWRMTLPAVRNRIALRGWILLEWGDSVGAEALRGPERLPGLLHHRTLLIAPADPAAVVDLAALPAWRFRRPREWRSLDVGVHALLELVSGERESRALRR
jgi:hypothetical protein